MTNKKPNGAWVLTREVNAYDQEGAYFVAVWAEQPTTEELAAFFNYADESVVVGSVMDALQFLLHLQKGGGRRGTEHEWYNLEFVEFGRRAD